MSEKSFSCRPVSPQYSFEIAAQFADDLELNRSNTLFLPERGRLIDLLTRAIESGQIKLTAFVSDNISDPASISASLTTGFLRASDGKSLEPKNISISVDSTWIKSLDIPTNNEIPISSGTQ